MERLNFSLMDKVHTALDILDSFEVKCQQGIEKAEDDIKNARFEMAHLLNGREAIELEPDEYEEYIGCCYDIERLQFVADFYKEILDAAVRSFIKVMTNSKED